MTDEEAAEKWHDSHAANNGERHIARLAFLAGIEYQKNKTEEKKESLSKKLESSFPPSPYPADLAYRDCFRILSERIEALEIEMMEKK